MDIGIAASIATFIDLSVKVASLCINYAKDVKNARNEITRLQTKVEGLEKVAKDVQQLLDGDQGGALSTSHKLKQAVLDCYTQIESVQNKLDPSKGRKIMRRFGVRALKWPFESGEVDKIIADLEKCNTNISSALQVDQTRTILDIRKEIDLEKIPSAQGAAFDSYTNELDARCHPETRKDLLHQVRDWAKDSPGKCIFWLNGVAGTGKSTISRTVAQSFNDDGQLGASFFFKRGESERENASKFFTTIAAQLLRRIPGLIPHIRSAIEEEPEIAAKSLERQFKSLVFQPLEKLNRAIPLVLVVDALDECQGDNIIKQVLHLLAKMHELKTVQVRVFLTSRPELPIRLGFDRMSPGTHHGMILQDVPPATIQHDISVFLEGEFSKIKSDFNLAHKYSPESQLSPDWPGDEIIQKLAKIAIPLFIFAATISRFVGDTRDWNPKQRLATILEYGTTREDSQPDTTQEESSRLQLDQTYVPVLKQLEFGKTERELERFGQQFRNIVGSIVILADPLSTSSLSNLLGISKDKVEGKLHSLHSVLSVPSDPNLPVRLLHLSFREFLVDPEKERRDYWFWTDEKKAHAMIATRCLEVLSSRLKENICSLEYPGMSRRELNSAKIDERLPEHVRYSCRYWVYHLKRSGGRIFNEDAVHTFLRNHFLHWLEALSLIGQISDCISLIDTLRSLTDENKESEVSRFIYDARRFLLQNRRVVNEAPLQLYSSAIIFSPETSIVKTTFRDHVPKWIYRLPKAPEFWGAELQKLEGHSGSVNAVAFSPDGKQLASASDDRTVRLWDATTGEQVKTLEGYSGWITAVAFSSDGKQLASASGDRTVRLWDAATGEQVKTLEGYSGWVTAVAFSSDGKQLASASDDGTVRLWDATTGEQVKTLEGHSGSVRAVAFSPDGKQLASASNDGTVRLWDATTGEQVKTLEGHSGSVTAVAFSSDGKQLASASDDRTVRLWDATTGEQVKTLEGHSGSITAVAFSPGGKQLASASDDRTVRLWDATTGEQVKTLERHSGSVTAVAFSPDGKQLASASDDGTVRLWDATTEEQVKTLEGHSGWVIAVAFSPDGKQLASTSDDRTVRLWDATTGEQVKTLEGHSGSVTAVAFSPDGKQLASASGDGTVRLWDATTGEQVKILEGHSSWVTAVAFSPDGKQLASASGDGTVKLWDAATGEQVKTLEPQAIIQSLHFSSDSGRLETDRGVLAIPPSPPSFMQPLPRKPSDHIFLSGEWITRDSQNLLWLPHDYRDSRSVLSGKLLVIGQKSGAVSFFGFM